MYTLDKYDLLVIHNLVSISGRSKEEIDKYITGIYMQKAPNGQTKYYMPILCESIYIDKSVVTPQFFFQIQNYYCADMGEDQIKLMA